MKRRAFVGSLAAWPVFAATPEKSEAKSIRDIAEGFLHEHGIQGLSIAYGRDGTVEFEHGYGFADTDGKEAVTPEHRFRIASVSKPITATAVMMSVEKGQLKLDDKVFGPQSVLGDAYGSKLPESVLAITIDHLLTHTSGGWANDKNDPMFKNAAMKHDELIAWTLANQKQTHKPGEHYAYSNFGYCVLGRVLEKVTKLPYETLITQQVLSKCGITNMKIAGNTSAERQPKEAMYLTEKTGAAYSMNVVRMDSHGGWIATAGDLVRFASQLPKLLNEESIRTMTTAMSASYARGWNVNKVPNWWHGGSLPGTSTIMVHTAKGVCWAGLMNGRKEGIGLALDKLMWQMGGVVKAWGL
ncbi:MAG: serine hydrolase domain-containing protein [Prosthecobacter sp.]|uniref:serine hydrolase domain-containing protein n=1 Tax=Prosthecobacter sp. TaxID=1965333 RepID=UPI0039020B73